jgi:hypothetical protein
MTDPAPWIRFQGKNKAHIIGSFENVHGERYVVWRNENSDTPYFTGDEVDWAPKNGSGQRPLCSVKTSAPK